MSLADDLEREPWRFNLLDLLRRLERDNPHLPRLGRSNTSREEFVRLGQDPYTAFPASNISGVVRGADGILTIYSRFLGLLGPQGALPLDLTIEAQQFQEHANDDALPRFLDIINRRFIQLFFRAWSDARPAGQYDRPDDDRFVSYVAAAAGFATEPFQHRDSLPDGTRLALAGLMGPAVKSLSRVESMLSFVFAVKPVAQPLAGTWLKLSAEDQTALGGSNVALGRDTIMGSAVFSLQDKFRIQIEVKGLAEFEEFLPEGRHFDRLVDLLYFYLGDLLEYDMQLMIPASATRPATLGGFGRLGWTSWMAPDRSDPEARRGDCIFHPAERAAQRRATGPGPNPEGGH